ncbi:MAG: TonB-dependent receptor [Tannerellaceae bacterium]|jgi:outer membrane receptor for ferrienterochelin and colicins|nr:TonB-dependent receptor [Tannerellaceae bacterium]
MRIIYLLVLLLAGFHIHAQNSDLLIEADEKLVELDQVVVTATRIERNLKNVPIAIQVINNKNIEKMQVSTMRDLLEYELPGIEFTNNGGYTNINMLGFSGKYVLFLVDGERMAGESFDNIDYNRIDMENIERIEIIKGASSSLYGSNAVGGVINIITKKPSQPFNVQAAARGGSENEQNQNLSISSKQKWGWLNLTGAYKARDPYLLHDAYVAGYKDYSITPKVSFNWGSKLELEAKGGYYFKERNQGGMDGKKMRNHFYDYSGGLKGTYSISGEQHISVSGNYDRYDKYNYYKLLNEKEKNYENEQIRFSTLYDRMIAGKHSLVAGIEYFSEALMTYMFESDGTNESKNAQTYSIFAQQDWALNDRITFVGGLRYDYHSQFKGHLSPRLSAMYKPVDRITLRGGYSGGFRSPTLKELYTDWFHPYGGGFQIIGNKDMKAESGNNFNFSAEGIFGKTLFTAMVQYSVIGDKIDNVWVNNDTTQYINIGKAKIFGSEFSISHTFNNRIHIKGTYAYVHDDLGRRSTIRPHTATLRADYTASFFKSYNPAISFSGKYFSGMDIYATGDITETDDETGIDKEADKEYKVRYDAYSIWRLTLTQPLPFNLSLHAGINNLFDYKTKFYSFYSSISPGRTFYIGLKWSLK